MPDFKPILAVDFDGVVHRYSQGWCGGKLYDDITPGFWVWAAKARDLFTLVIYSSRSKTREGRDAMREWMAHEWSKRCLLAGVQGHVGHDDDKLSVSSPADVPINFEFAAEKPPAWLTIDDRCVRFDGSWEHPALTPETLIAYKPWMQRDAPCA